ncbi:NAD(P)H-hydrate epimerase [Frigoribacterium sp. ACAM 257]|uniref:NAD(P)H-hydrate epimerase n=1 Tax=Frigoribacterium sp. ACAM 257 TaxID=2508998 RepID=UPI0011B995B4|nr:NAD(P)H-hydrate epimerase [Frigoribacterium sp. ACAM 257]TWX40051.1 NAD(P)H-hydrate epimerase [Frigoribacterium sp. ACAM 257]
MIDAWTAAQVKAAEQPHLDAGEPLMQRASEGLAREVERLLRTSGRWPAPVVLLVGSGSNGGDALFAGALLADGGCTVTVVPTGSRLHEEGLAAARASGAVVDDAARWSTIEEAGAGLRESGAAVVIDGVLGTGTSAHPALRGAARDVVAALLPWVTAPEGPLVVAVDVPSGIGPDDGAVPDQTVLPATLTVTFGAHKAGLLLEPAAALAGEVVLVDIGLLPDLIAVPPAVSVPGPAS